MKLRFAVNQGEALRKGIDCPSSRATIDVDPSKLSEEERQLIADRMWPGGIEVFQLRYDPTAKQLYRYRELAFMILAEAPSFPGLIEAIRKNEAEINAAKEAK